MAILSINEILANEIQQYLEGSDAVLIKTITDLSSQVSIGMDRVTVPRISGLALSNVVSGTRATAGGMTTAGDVLLLDQAKQVPEYIDYSDGIESAIDLKAAFIEAAPRIFAEGVEGVISTALLTVSAGDFESSASGAGNFNIADIANAKKVLDQASVPKSDRWLAVDAEGMEILASFSEFEDGSKSLTDEALRQGVVSRVKGFYVVQSEDVTSGKIHCYHRSAIAFAMQDSVNLIEKMNEEYAQEFVALRGKFGVKALDAGVRKLTISTDT